MLLVRFVHYLGLAMWIGGWLAMSVLVVAARSESPQVRAGLFGLLAKAHNLVIGPGVLLTFGSGLLWSMALVGAGDVQARVAPFGTSVMTATGVLGGLLVVVVALPAAVKMKALAIPTADGQMLPAFEQQRKRLVSASNIAGAFALASLFASVFTP